MSINYELGIIYKKKYKHFQTFFKSEVSDSLAHLIDGILVQSSVLIIREMKKKKYWYNEIFSRCIVQGVH